jgi:hypothetical protein
MSSLVRQMLKTASLSTEIFKFLLLLYHDTNISTNLHSEIFFQIQKKAQRPWFAMKRSEFNFTKPKFSQRMQELRLDYNA